MSQVRTRLTFSNSQTAHRLTAPMRPFSCCNATPPTVLLRIWGRTTSLTWNSSITKLEGGLRFMKLVATKFASSNSDWLMSDGVCSRILLTPLCISGGATARACFLWKGSTFRTSAVECVLCLEESDRAYTLMCLFACYLQNDLLYSVTMCKIWMFCLPR